MNKKNFKSTQNSKERESLETQIRERMFECGADECIVLFSNNDCSIHVSKMYHGLGNLISFDNMKWLSNLLKTDNINLRDEYYKTGCDTCDYGSSHSVDFICKNIIMI